MIKGIQVILYPTYEQEQKFWQSAGNARVAYNYGIDLIESHYAENKKSLCPLQARKQFNAEKKTDEDISFVTENSADATGHAFQDLKIAYKNFFEKLKKGIPFKQAGYPKRKSRKKSKISFYHEARKLKVSENGIQFEKIGTVKFRDDGRLPYGNYLKDGINVVNPRIKHDGKNWYLAVGIECPEPKAPELVEDLSIGVDLGIKELAVTNVDGLRFKNINKTKEVLRLEQKLRRKQRALARSREANTKSKTYHLKGKKKGQVKSVTYDRPFRECRNYQKKKKEIALVHRRLANIRKDYLHKATKEIILRHPSRIVMEDLNVKGMMKNRHLSRSIGQMGWGYFKDFMKYKAKFHLGIEVEFAPRFFPSTQTCSSCGHRKTGDQKVKLKDRTYRCDCGLVLDRDVNAAINLAAYTTT